MTSKQMRTIVLGLAMALLLGTALWLVVFGPLSRGEAGKKKIARLTVIELYLDEHVPGAENGVHVADVQLEGGTARYDLACIQRHAGHRIRRCTKLTRIGMRVGSRICLQMILWLRDDDGIDQHSRNCDLARLQRPPFGNPLDLDNHYATGILRRHGL